MKVTIQKVETKKTKAPAGYISGMTLGNVIKKTMLSAGFRASTCEFFNCYGAIFQFVKKNVTALDNGYHGPGIKYFYPEADTYEMIRKAFEKEIWK